jgi:hypothetical protein
MRTFRLLLVLSILSFSLQLVSQAVCSYGYRKRITFNPAQVAGPIDLTNFPALINIASDNDLRTVANSGHVQNASGFDIIFTASDGVTLLNFQLEFYNATNGNLTAWVNIPVLSTSLNTDIYMYYGNAAIVANQSSSATWSGYRAVWHYQGNSFADASPNNYASTNNGTTNQAAAKINNGRALNGTQWIEVTAFPNLNTNFSISAWINTSDRTTAGQRIFCDDVNNTGGYGFSLGDGGAGLLRFYARGSTNVSVDSPNSITSNNTWFYVAAIADISNNVRRIFVNGVQVATISSVGWGTDAGNSSVGGETAAGETANRFRGQMDEVRIANSALSADWLLTEYNNQNNPAGFYSISVEPKVWTGGTSTNFNTASNWLNSSAPGSGDDVIINNGTNQPTLQSNLQVNSLFVRTGANLSLSTFNLSVSRDITNCGTITGNTSTLTLNSTSAFVQIQHLSGTGTFNLNSLTVNNTFATGPEITLNKDVNIAGDLVLTSGIVNTTSTNILALASGATSTSGSALSFVDGPMTKAGTSNFVFPVGKVSTWRRIGIANLSASTTFRAEYFNSTPTGTGSIAAGLYNVSILEYWQLDRTVGAGNANVSLYWENAGSSGINDCTDLTVARYNGTTWVEEAGTTSGGSSCAGAGTGTVSTTALVTSFSPFTFGSKTYLVNPLPIELLSFNAICISEGLKINWSTASEKNHHYFELQRSFDGLNWTSIDRIYGSANSSVQKNYSITKPMFSEQIQYLKLKQVDLDQSTWFSPVISVQCSKSELEFNFYPNPAEREIKVEISSNASEGERADLKIIDITGKLVQQEQILFNASSQTIKLSNAIQEGVYLLSLESDHHSRQVRKLIVQP